MFPLVRGIPCCAYRRVRVMVMMYTGIVAVIGSRMPMPPMAAGRCKSGIAWSGRFLCCVMVAMVLWMIVRIVKVASECQK